MLKTFVAKIRETASSRKFWVAVSTSIPFLLEEPRNYPGFVAVWLTWMGIEGAQDIARIVTQRKTLAITASEPVREEKGE